MRLSDDMPIISRALLEEDERWRRESATLTGDNGDSLISDMVGGTAVGRWPTRAELEELELFSCLYLASVAMMIKTCFDTYSEIRRMLYAGGRATRRRIEPLKSTDRGPHAAMLLGIRRRVVLHLSVVYAMGVRSGSPLERLRLETELLPGLATFLAELRSPAAFLRAAWLLSSREEVSGEAFMDEMHEHSSAGELTAIATVYSVAALGRLLHVPREERDVLLASFAHHAADLEGDGSRPPTYLPRQLRRTLWCWEHRDLPLHERARLLAQHPYTTIPDWAKRFYDPALLEREPERAVQELLACEHLAFVSLGEAALLWLYMPEIARRAAPLLYPIQPPPPTSPKEREARDFDYIEYIAQGEHVSRVVVSQKQGRNEPCACGSGKKYKKCCGVNQDDQEV
jgi:hypothetical protein